MVPWVHPSLHPKRHCYFHGCVQQTYRQTHTHRPRYICSNRPHLCTGCTRCDLKGLTCCPTGSSKSALNQTYDLTSKLSNKSQLAEMLRTSCCRKSRSIVLTQTLCLTGCYFYPRDAMLARVLAMALCLSVFVCLSQVGVVYIEVVGRIELVFGIEASFDLSCTVF